MQSQRDIELFKFICPKELSSNLGYRGDSRHPIDDQIFTHGMEARDKSQPPYREDDTPNPVSRVCFSHDLPVATLFPLSKEDQTWIYIIKIHKNDDYTDFNSHLLNDPNITILLAFFYSNEASVSRIEAANIIGAVKCTRKIPSHYLDGGIYQLTEYIENKNCLVSDEEQKIVADGMKEILNQWGEIPVPFDGVKHIPQEIITTEEQKTFLIKFYLSSLRSHENNQQYVKTLIDENKDFNLEIKEDLKLDTIKKPIQKSDEKSNLALQGLFSKRKTSNVANENENNFTYFCSIL